MNDAPVRPVTDETVTELDAETERVESVLDLPSDAATWFIRLEATSVP